MLYYHINLWCNQCGPTPSHLRPCTPVTRVNGTAFTDWNPGTWPGSNPGTKTTPVTPFNSLVGDANGEGSLVYPGEDGPVGSIRLVNIADGIEGAFSATESGLFVYVALTMMDGF